GGTNDIGIAVRGEPNSAIADTDANWGLEGKSVANTYNCSGLSTKCGDPNGCAPSSFTAGQIVCFSVRACPHVGTSYPTSSCSSSWGVRPAVGSNDAIDVIVVYKYATMTTLIAGFVPGGIFYLRGETRAVESY
ncbi:MAG TPA: hypothetical protein VGR61_11685, partial [Candidatus Dormibacteraeota bacterium]|nr:hypothetical protein [Candidatus Dormibacteraeota bacterium]